MNYKKTILFSAIILGIGFFWDYSFAQESISLVNPIGGNAENPNGITSIATVVGTVIKFFLGILGSIALLSFLYAGYTYLTSLGNSEKLQKGLIIAYYSCVGMAVVFGAYAILNFIITGLGVKNLSPENNNQISTEPIIQNIESNVEPIPSQDFQGLSGDGAREDVLTTIYLSCSCTKGVENEEKECLSGSDIKTEVSERDLVSNVPEVLSSVASSCSDFCRSEFRDNSNVVLEETDYALDTNSTNRQCELLR